MAKLKATFNGTLTHGRFDSESGPTVTFNYDLGVNNSDLLSVEEGEYVTVPVDAKRFAKLVGVTDVEITITVTPKGAKKVRKAKAKGVKTGTAPATTTTEAVPVTTTEAA